MKSVHITLQGKGGVGKSYISSLITQYLRHKDLPVIAIDTDPVNSTLAGYKALNAKTLQLLTDGVINERMFDKLIEGIVTEDCHFVVDNGASSFIPLSNYLTENAAIDVIGDHGKQVFIHTIVTGGQALGDTLAGFVALADHMPPEAKLVIWQNEFFGPIEKNGVPFEKFDEYILREGRVYGMITIPKQTSTTFGQDVQQLLDRKMTFDEVNMSEQFNLMSKSRLFRIKATLFDQMAVFM